ncbi:hypothetical protein A258_16822 [Pseudomonas syringae pv. actinidiae ICMP 19104]|nr:hypothetical protein A258_16822 [Pseudomonas syringae pv. actinidiae ICMP 19104]KCU96711.1 hypothetical protein A250_17793 [Pseudomonas syringae pv. actinidiae ICMP 9617]
MPRWQLRIVEGGIGCVLRQKMPIVTRGQCCQPGMTTAAVAVLHDGFGLRHLQGIEHLAEFLRQRARAATGTESTQ